MYDNTNTLVYPNDVNRQLFAKKIVINGGEVFRYEEDAGSETNKTHFYNEYDSNGNLLKNLLLNNARSYEVETDPNTAYILMTVWLRTKNNIAYIPLSSSFGGLKIYAFGDSITAGYMSSPSGESMSPYGGYIGLSTTLSNRISVTNLGNPTGGFVHKGNNGKNGCEILDDATITNADVVTIAYGINDWGQSGVTLGTTSSTSGDGTVSGSIRYMIETAITKAPFASIVLISPLNIWKYTRSGTPLSVNNDYAIGTAGTNGFTLQELFDIMKHWADYYHVTLVDWTHKNPVANLNNMTSLYDDGIHPNDTAYHKLAYAYIKSIPMWFAD